MAAKENKLVFVFLFSNSCDRSKQSDAETFTNVRVVKLLNDKFVCVRLDVYLGENDKVVYELKCQGTPGMASYSADGRKLAYFDKYRTPESFGYI